jgi:murein DD-endopeptidase MepM/ murein hydrolase activator NlpD
MEVFSAPKNINPQNPGNVKSSQLLVLDDSALAPVHSPVYDGATVPDFIPSPLESDQISLYTVKDGDTISDVAQMYGVSTNTILWANDINKSTSLKKGQVLIILPVNGVKYTIKKGDTLQSVAKRFDSHPEDIRNFNNLNETGGVLAIGDEIIIPEGEMEPSKPSTPGSKDLIAPATKNGLILGYFIRPVPSGKKTQGLHGHNGVDIGAVYGAPILAPADGKVILAKFGGWGGGYGNYIIIQHPNGMQTLYGHMSQFNVSLGATVKQGQTIGYVGSSGKSTGPHLHIEVHQIGSSNPANKFY